MRSGSPADKWAQRDGRRGNPILGNRDPRFGTIFGGARIGSRPTTSPTCSTRRPSRDRWTEVECGSNDSQRRPGQNKRLDEPKFRGRKGIHLVKVNLGALTPAAGYEFPY